MRIPRLIAATAATTAAAATVAAIFADPQPASALSFAVLTLSPSSGPSTTGITARYRYLPLDRKSTNRCGTEPVTITWEHQQLPEQAEPVLASGYCVATLTFTPPAALASPGQHTVTVRQGQDGASAIFTVTGSAAPAPVPPPPSRSAAPATSTASASARPSPSAAPSATASPNAAAPESAEPLPSEEPGDGASPNVVGATVKPPTGGSIGTGLAVLVGVLAVGGAGILLTLALRRRPDVDEVELPEDAATA